VRGGLSAFGILAASLSLYACASAPPPPANTPVAAAPPSRAPTAIPPQPSPPPLTFADLPGWSREDHAEALRAFQSGCGVARDPDLHAACQRAQALGPADERVARSFLEANFRPQRVGAQGLLTAYFAPEYEARARRSPPFTAPVREKPADLVMLDLGPFDPSLAGKKVSGHVVGGVFAPYDDRAAIEATPARAPIAWMKPEELFFLQIQGSGVLKLQDGDRIKVTYSASNGKPFVGIANILRARGALADSETSGEAIRAWLADHRGPEADEVMRQNPRYVFFKAAPDDGREPPGAAGAALIPGRALAMDPSKHPMGGVYWIDAKAPALNGAFPVYQRLAIALDVGGAIKGPVRADLYTGSGPVAGAEAGRVRHQLDLYALTPIPAEAP
jgi:membrane-bound lytic murein transglycosylase A